MNEETTTAFSQWEHDGPFLSWFPRSAQSTIANWFCYAVRDGATLVFQVLQDVERQALRKRATEAVTEEVLDQLASDLQSPEAEDFAAFILWRESLPADEKARLKAASEKAHINAYMADQPPTEKQLKYLKGLRCATVPKTKLEASQLIDQHVKGRQQ